jgi:hypothetical protein
VLAWCLGQRRGRNKEQESAANAALAGQSKTAMPSPFAGYPPEAGQLRYGAGHYPGGGLPQVHDQSSPREMDADMAPDRRLTTTVGAPAEDWAPGEDGVPVEDGVPRREDGTIY